MGCVQTQNEATNVQVMDDIVEKQPRPPSLEMLNMSTCADISDDEVKISVVSKGKWFVDESKENRIYVSDKLSSKFSNMKLHESIEYNIGDVKYSAKKLSKDWIIQINHKTMIKIDLHFDQFGHYNTQNKCTKDNTYTTSNKRWQSTDGSVIIVCDKTVSDIFTQLKNGEQVT